MIHNNKAKEEHKNKTPKNTGFAFFIISGLIFIQM